MANMQFFEQVFRTLKDGGLWGSTDGEYVMRRKGDVFVADKDTYKHINRLVPEFWFVRRVRPL